MKLIQCPLCALASQMKSVILSHISQVHPDHPKRIITTSYTTCQKKLQEEENGATKEAEKPKERRRRKSSASAGAAQQNTTSEGLSGEAESQKLKTKPNILQKRRGVVGGIGGSMNCNFVCGTCSYSTNVQDDFHDHIITCVKSKKPSPKPALIHLSGGKDAEVPQAVIIELDDVQTNTTKDHHARKSKPGSRSWEGTEVELQEDTQPDVSQQENVPEPNEVEKPDVAPDKADVPETEQRPKPQLKLPRPMIIPPEPGKLLTDCE